MDKTFYLYSLGCPKNEVDSESMSALLKEKGYRFTDDRKEASFLVVNTCAFLESAVT
ncbi:MAG: 30S ribosomal protein S12 methylthiotransferase RimO, partial [Clostridia bacterium]|nr:30S ribosomal protein S12 methylthiotransferase RimO [Clostridia bacterium]